MTEHQRWFWRRGPEIEPMRIRVFWVAEPPDWVGGETEYGIMRGNMQEIEALERRLARLEEAGWATEMGTMRIIEAGGRR